MRLILFARDQDFELEFVLDRDALVVPGDFRRVVRLTVIWNDENAEEGEIRHELSIKKHDLPLDVYASNLACAIMEMYHVEAAGPELYEVIAPLERIVVYLHDELRVPTETRKLNLHQCRF